MGVAPIDQASTSPQSRRTRRETGRRRVDLLIGSIGGTVISWKVASRERSPSRGRWGIVRPGDTIEDSGFSERPSMMDLDGYRTRVRYKGLEGLSEIGFKRYDVRLEDLFPTADEVILSMKAYFQRLDEAAALMYEVPDARFGVVENKGLLELAVPDARGEYTGMIIDVLALDVTDTHLMLDDIEKTCGFIQARFRDALGIMTMSQSDYVRRLRDSMRLLANALRHDT